MKKIELNNNWEFKIENSSSEIEKYNSWMECDVPGTVHTDLLNLGLIEDPYFEDNENRLQWVSEQDWVYKTTFDLTGNFDSDTPINLVFEGVDTIAEAWLNAKLIGNFQNMFRTYEFEISKLLKTQNNLLEIRFYSPTKYAKGQEKKYGKLQVELNSERVYIRKAQYSFGWDWGPSFPTLGLWKPVYLVQHSKAYIQNVSFNTIDLRDDTAEVEVGVSIGGDDLEGLGVDVSLIRNEQINEDFVTGIKYKNKIKFEINTPQLWFPFGAGEQSLYNLKVELKSLNGEQLDLVERKVGILTILLKLNENKKSTFKFIINNKDIFIKGVNWIPADLFLPRVSKEKYLKLILLAKEANCNMIRVWGGGVYETDYFYELCDEHGILVWQDFMFACGAYPEQEEFLENIEKEICQTVERLQYHPSIVLWCGNNENEWIWYRVHDTDISKMPGYKIYHFIIPDILAKIDSGRPYWPSSPFGNNKDPNDQGRGNTHQWDIWSDWIDYTEVKNDNSLFVTEFGFQAPANISTWEGALSKDKLHCQNQIFESHNKQTEGQERLFKFLSGHLPVSNEWNDFIYLTQLNQALALKTCIEHWRTNRITNGTLIWQLNDCWPAVSWSIIDSELIPKLSYYFVKNSYSPQLVLIKKEDFFLNFYLINQTGDEFRGYIKINFIDPSSGNIFQEEKNNILVEAYDLKIVDTVSVLELPKNNEWLIIISLYDEKRLVHRNFYLEKKWKHIFLPDSKVRVDSKPGVDCKELKLTTEKLGIFVDLYHPRLIFFDRGFLLLPEEEKLIYILSKDSERIDINDIKIKTLNNFLRR